MTLIKLIHITLWLALVIGVGEVSVTFVREMREAAIEVHKKGPISHKLFTEQLTGQK